MVGYNIEDLSLGQSAQRTHLITEADILAFAEVSGDFNPVHMDEASAATTPFKGRIAHGMLAAAYISAVIAADLPGEGTIYLSQSLRFRRPVRIGDLVATEVTVAAVDLAKRCVTLNTKCRVGAKVVLDGQAQVLAPSRGG